MYDILASFQNKISVNDNEVALIDCMPRMCPNNSTMEYLIAQSARVSYGNDRKEVNSERDSNLISYLIRNDHSSPFEMVSFVFRIKCPIFVARQIMRHRTCCVTGDSLIYFDDMNKIQIRPSVTMSIRRLHDALFKHGEYLKYSKLYIRGYDTHTNKLCHTRIVDCAISGFQPVFKLILQDRFTIKVTRNHKFYAVDSEGKIGYQSLEDIIGLYQKSNGIWAASKRNCYFFTSNINTDVDCCYSRYTSVSVDVKGFVDILYVGSETVYDLTVASFGTNNDRNFICNDIVIHNSYNEYSARYSILKDDIFVPSEWRKQHLILKQSSSFDDSFSKDENEYLTNIYNEAVKITRNTYEELLKKGVSKELARCILPVSQYTEFYMKVDLNNLFRFLKLRMDYHAQKEVRDIANMIYELVEPRVPSAFNTWIKHKLNSISFTKEEADAFKKGELNLPNASKTENYEYQEKVKRILS
jgi:thymidylate synthase ThyX